MQKLHKNELDIHIGTIQDLIAEQFPEFGRLPVERFDSHGTVNAIFRLGRDYYARLPRQAPYSLDIERECLILPGLAAHLSLQIPEPVGLGKPGGAYPFNWAIYRWIEGEPYSDSTIRNEFEAAETLARFILELGGIELKDDIPEAGRPPLDELNSETVQAIQASTEYFDPKRVLYAWKHALAAPKWDGVPVWIHTDLLRTNILVREGNIAAIIDFGSAGKGDPAFDLVPAWSVFNKGARRHFRELLAADASTWERGRGYALHQALLIIPYYWSSYPEFTKMAVRTVNEILRDLGL